MRVKTLNRLKVDEDDVVNAFASRKFQRRVMFKKQTGLDFEEDGVVNAFAAYEGNN